MLTLEILLENFWPDLIILKEEPTDGKSLAHNNLNMSDFNYCAFEYAA